MRLPALTIAAFTCGCAGGHVPAAGTMATGPGWRGDVRTSVLMDTGTLTLSDGRTTCTAPLQDWGTRPTILIAAACSDGRTARGRISRSASAYASVFAGDAEPVFPDGQRILVAFGPGV